MISVKEKYHTSTRAHKRTQRTEIIRSNRNAIEIPPTRRIQRSGRTTLARRNLNLLPRKNLAAAATGRRTRRSAMIDQVVRSSCIQDGR